VEQRTPGERIAGQVNDPVIEIRPGVLRPHDVAVIDLGLPGLDGFEVARRLRAAVGNTVTLIAYTAYNESESRARAEAAGFDAYLVKPRDLDGLLRWFNPQVHGPV
jgi:CheY-like chemotaxis protein